MRLGPIDWKKVYINTSPKLIGICRRYVKNSLVAEDLMHDAFIAAISKANTYKGKGTVENWLKKITINTALLYLRANKNVMIFNEGLADIPFDQDQEPDVPHIEQKRIIENANYNQSELLEIIDLLPNHHKIVFNLYVIDGYTHKEIGKTLNISPGTSKSHLARARKRIQHLLYEKAQQMEKEKWIRKSRKYALIFIIIPCRANFIDRIFVKSFTKFSIQPTKMPEALTGLLNHISPGKRPFRAGISDYKAIYLTSAVVFTSIAICFFALRSIEKEKNENMQQNPLTIKKKLNITDSTIISPDTSIIEMSLKDSIRSTIHKQSIDGKRQTVVFKKPVYVHKKVIIRDTINQVITKNNEE